MSTELNGMHYQDQWDSYAETMLKGTFLREAAAECGISLKTSFNWRHKFLQLVDNLTDSRLEGIVEIDETEFTWSEKGNRDLDHIFIRSCNSSRSATLSQICYHAWPQTWFCAVMVI